MNPVHRIVLSVIVAAAMPLLAGCQLTVMLCD